MRVEEFDKRMEHGTFVYQKRRLAMNFILSELAPSDLKQFKSDIQEAFQKGFENVYGKTEVIVLPEQDIDRSLNEKGAIV